MGIFPARLFLRQSSAFERCPDSDDGRDVAIILDDEYVLLDRPITLPIAWDPREAGVSPYEIPIMISLR
jgi:hypothetical protein